MKTKKSGKPRKQNNYSAQEKCRAVLSVWTERRKPAEVCRELSINWTILNQWQNRALEGMFQALELRVNLERTPALSPKLQALLEKKYKRERKEEVRKTAQKLGDRLSRIQDSKDRKEEKDKKT